jgi:hypothetical protein
MPSLAEVLTNDSKKGEVIDACCTLIDEEVADKGGLSGLAIKAGYKAVKGVKPGFVKHAVGELLPDFAKALDPLYNDAKSANKPVSEYFVANSGKVADALLAITDERARNAKSGLVKGTYDKLRSTAKKNVEQAVPRLGRMVERFSS